MHLHKHSERMLARADVGLRITQRVTKLLDGLRPKRADISSTEFCEAGEAPSRSFMETVLQSFGISWRPVLRALCTIMSSVFSRCAASGNPAAMLRSALRPTSSVDMRR